jgi:hypothetical protein
MKTARFWRESRPHATTKKVTRVPDTSRRDLLRAEQGQTVRALEREGNGRLSQLKKLIQVIAENGILTYTDLRRKEKME